MGLACTATGLLARHARSSTHVAVISAAGAQYLMLPVLPGLALLASTRSRVGTLAATTLAVLAGWSQAPLLVPDRATRGSGPEIMVLTANLLMGRADAEELVAAARKHEADVLMVQELTPDAVTRLRAAGIDIRLPFNFLAAEADGSGLGIWSRRPLREPTRRTEISNGYLSARFDLGNGAGGPLLICVHAAGPYPWDPADWWADMRTFPELFGSALRSAGGHGVIVGGDFNATWDSAAFRDLLRGGLRDAAEQTGHPASFTYPADKRYPPVIAIDHVLTAGARARSFSTFRIPGSDHRGVAVGLSLPS